MIISVLTLMTLPFFSSAVQFHNSVNENQFIPYPTNVLMVEGEPEEVNIIVYLMRVRSLSLSDNRIQFTVLIDGNNAMSDFNPILSGYDTQIEWPLASLQVEYEINKEIPIQISLMKKGLLPSQCDISPQQGQYAFGKELTIFYNLSTGEWHGDDFCGDASGYGHASGFEDGIYNEDDYEIWFDVYEAESFYHGEGRLTYWDKLNMGLNASLNYDYDDIDGDGIPCYWEDKYGYDPLVPEDHSNLDPDADGLNNIEELRTSQWFSDPFMPDVFVEVDGMQARYLRQPDYILPKESQYKIMDEFLKHNISIHFDDGTMGGGGDLIPYDDSMWGDELLAMRDKYFLNGDPDNWRQGVFHYAIICTQMGWYGRPAGGRAFYSGSHCVGAQYVRNWLPLIKLQGSDYNTALASVFMHELGHTLGLNHFEGIDNENSRFPWNTAYWEWGSYHSCMNYRYVYKYVGYSEGDDQTNDQNDWDVVLHSLTLFDGDGW